MWLYLAGKGLLADVVGMGKTAVVGAVLALCKETGELSPANRAIIICQPAAIGQWARELTRMIPSLRLITAPGSDTRQKRIAAYASSWEVAVLSDRTLAPARGKVRSREGDIALLRQFSIGCVVYDDIDAMRSRGNRSANALRQLTETAPRVIGVHGTPVQKRLMELYSFLEPLGGRVVLGTPQQFHYRYVRTADETYYVRDPEDPTGRSVQRVRVRDVGIRPENAQELKRLIAPLVLRRRPQDADDVSLPEVVSNVVWLDPSPEQARRYEELRQGVLRKIAEDGEVITHPQAVAYFMHGWQICSGLATLDGGRDDSVKLDWLMNRVTGDFEDDKAVVFVNFKPNVAALSQRLAAENVGHVLMWGNETGQGERDRRLRQFQEDPACRVLVGTTTIERSLNLQTARHFVAVDTVRNPARMTQLVGRVRRVGSAFPTVYFHQLLLRGTQEEVIPAQLETEQATADTVWGEQGELFQRRTPLEIMQMITRRSA
jgi:SNF2 family DNA or RNA helicase